jgi:cardiolipin synthase
MSARSASVNPANALTLLRLALVPVYALLQLQASPAWAFAVFAAAALSDLLDGWLARRFGWVTPLGVFIDPVADKALQLTAFTLLGWNGRLPVWVVVLAWSRELLVVSGFVLLALVAHIRTVKATWLGKTGTFAQMGFLTALLGAQAVGAPVGVLVLLSLALGAAVLLHLAGGLDYAWRGFQAYEALNRDTERKA